MVNKYIQSFQEEIITPLLGNYIIFQKVSGSIEQKGLNEILYISPNVKEFMIKSGIIQGIDLSKDSSFSLTDGPLFELAFGGGYSAEEVVSYIHRFEGEIPQQNNIYEYRNSLVEYLEFEGIKVIQDEKALILDLVTNDSLDVIIKHIGKIGMVKSLLELTKLDLIVGYS